jgi:hypothetical protein
MIAALATCGFVIWLYQKLASEDAGSDPTNGEPSASRQLESRLVELERRVREALASIGGNQR